MLIGLLLFLEISINLYSKYKSNSLKQASVHQKQDKSTKNLPEINLFYSELTEFKSYQYDSFLAWKNSPNIKGKYINTDALGRRVTIQDNNHSTSKTLHFFGGSTMWGHSVIDSGTIPSQFALINNTYKIINWGEQAYNSRQELNQLLNHLHAIKKGDIVVFFDGVNDIYNNCRKSNSVNGHVRHYEFENIIKSKKSIEASSICSVTKLLKQTTIYTTLQKYLIKKKIIKEQKIVTKNPSDGFDTTSICAIDKNKAIQVRDFLTTNWKSIESILKEKGVTFIPVLQPNPYTAQKITKHQGRKELMASSKSVYPLVGEVAQEIENYYDMSHIFENSNYYYDCCHVGRQANSIIAQKINDLIKKIEKSAT